MTKLMALITTAGRAAWSFPLHPFKAAPVGFALGHEQEWTSAAAFSALTLHTEPLDSVWSQYFMDPWGYGEITMIAPQLARDLDALMLAPVCAQFAPVESAPVLASGVALEPCSVLPSVTRVMLAPLGSSLPSLVTSRVYSAVLHGAPMDAHFEPPQAHYGAQLLPERTGHLKHGSMYWARLASDQVRTQLRSSDEVRVVDAFPCPSVPDDVTLCPPGCVPGNAEAWATEHSVGAAKLHLALNTTTVRTGAALTIALEEEVCSYLDGLEPYGVVSYVAAPDSTAMRVVLRSEFNRAALQAHVPAPLISIKAQSALELRSVELGRGGACGS